MKRLSDLIRKWGGDQPRRRLAWLGLTLLVLAAGLTWGGRNSLPLSGNVRKAEARAKQLRREARNLAAEKTAMQQDVQQMQLLAKPLWAKPSRPPITEIQTELEKAARRAQVQLQNVGGPQTGKISENLSSLAVTVRLTGSMREISRFLLELEQNEPRLFWSACTIRPENINEPRQVTLDGSVQIVAASAEAVKCLGETANAGGTP